MAVNRARQLEEEMGMIEKDIRNASGKVGNNGAGGSRGIREQIREIAEGAEIKRREHYGEYQELREEIEKIKSQIKGGSKRREASSSSCDREQQYTLQSQVLE